MCIPGCATFMNRRLNNRNNNIKNKKKTMNKNKYSLIIISNLKINYQPHLRNSNNDSNINNEVV